MNIKIALILILVFAGATHCTSGAFAEEAYVYDPHGKRDPFVPLLGVSARAAGSLEDIMGIEDVSLQGVAVDSTGGKVVVINGEMIAEGQTIGRLTIKKILNEEVVLIIDENEYTLNIYKDENR